MQMSTRARYGRPMRFRVLGPLEVDAGDGPLPLGGPKQRAVLANLLIRANQVVPADILIDAVWGEEPPEKARNTLQTYVSNLRKSLGDGRLEGRPPGYVLLLEPFELDASRFDALLRDAKKQLPVDPGVALADLDDALALWRGPALADLGDQPSLLAEAARLNELRIEAQEDRIEGLLSIGDQATAIGALELLLADHLLRERLWALLMLALYREGRQAEALGAYQRARERSWPTSSGSIPRPSSRGSRSGSSNRIRGSTCAASRSAAIGSSRRSGRARWARSFGRSSRTSVATWPSRSSTNGSPRTPSSSGASNPRRRQPRRWSTRTSRRCTITGANQAAHTSSPDICGAAAWRVWRLERSRSSRSARAG